MFLGLLICCFLLSWTSLNGQFSKDMDLEELSSSLAQKYEEESIALVHADIEYEFKVEEDELLVKEKVVNQYLGLKENVSFNYVKFYDEKSEINSILVRNGSGKKLKLFPTDRKYENGDYFHTDSRVKYVTVSPGKGELREIGSEKTTIDAKYFTKSIFQEPIPVVEMTVRFVIPKGVVVAFEEYNFDDFDIRKSETLDVKSGSKIVTYRVQELDPLPDERNSPGPFHFIPHVLVLPKSYLGDSGKKTIFQETKDMYAWYRTLVKSMDNNNKELASTVTNLLDGITDEEAKIKKLYYWVQDNIRYIAFEDGIAGFKPDDCQNVFNKKFGDCKGMANLLKEMLILAGFDARLTWIGTNHLPYDYSTPSLAVDNHMICTLIWKDKKYYLDPTEKYNSFGYSAARIQGKEAMIEDGEDFILAQVPVFQSEGNGEGLNWEGLRIEDEKLIGSGKVVYSGERLAEVLYGFNNMDASKREEAVERLVKGRDKNFVVTDLEYSDPNNRDEDFVVNYNVDLKNMVTSFDNSLFLDIDYYKEFGQSKFEDRKTDYVFSYKFNINNKLSIKIPDGFSVEELPEGLDIENEFVKVKANILEEKGFLKYEKYISLKKRKISTDEFELWNLTFSKLGEFYQKQVVLSKK